MYRVYKLKHGNNNADFFSYLYHLKIVILFAVEHDFTIDISNINAKLKNNFS